MVQSLVGLRPSFHFCWILLEHVIHSTSIHTFILKKCTGVIYVHSFCNCIHGYNMACLYILRFLLNAIYLESLAQVLLACFAGQGCVSTGGGGDQLNCRCRKGRWKLTDHGTGDAINIHRVWRCLYRCMSWVERVTVHCNILYGGNNGQIWMAALLDLQWVLYAFW